MKLDLVFRAEENMCGLETKNRGFEIEVQVVSQGDTAEFTGGWGHFKRIMRGKQRYNIGNTEEKALVL